MLTLVAPGARYRAQIEDYMEEWLASGERIVPGCLGSHDFRDFDGFIAYITRERAGIPGLVPATTLFALDEERGVIVGAVNIRHALNEHLLLAGGHIGDGVRPSERGKGYGTRMIALALKECAALGITRVLMTCDDDNLASARSIEKNGGVLENVIEYEGKPLRRYWIEN